MAEMVREIRLTLSVDTNKRTIEQEFGSLEELVEFWNSLADDDKLGIPTYALVQA